MRRLRIKCLLLIWAKKVWRSKNKHNYTYVENYFPVDLVSVGKYTYGPLRVYSWGHKHERLSIGSFVSIGKGTQFLLGGEHRYDTVSTYPFDVKFMGRKEEALTKGPIIIEDDVWIGMEAMVLSGVKIGRGAVIGARTLVSKDVPPYAVVVGNPMRLLRYRFNDDIVKRLLALDFRKIDKKFVRDNLPRLYASVSDALLKELDL